MVPGLSYLWHFGDFYIQCLCFTGGVEIIPLKCSDETEEQDTVRGLLGPANILSTLPHKDAGKYVYPPLGFKAKEGIYFDISV